MDTGRSKQKLMEAGGAMARYDVRWISKASGEQRAGRAGRTGPGHCYRCACSGNEHQNQQVLIIKASGKERVGSCKCTLGGQFYHCVSIGNDILTGEMSVIRRALFVSHFGADQNNVALM